MVNRARLVLEIRIRASVMVRANGCSDYRYLRTLVNTRVFVVVIENNDDVFTPGAPTTDTTRAYVHVSARIRCRTYSKGRQTLPVSTGRE